MENIISTKNEYVKLLRTLSRRSVRRELGLTLAEGAKCVREALENASVEAVFTTEPHLYADLDPSVRLISASPAVIAALSEAKTPQGHVAAVRIPEQPTSIPDGRVCVFLDSVSDPNNVGAIVRIADAAAACCVLMTRDCADPWSPKTIRSSMGSVFHLPMIEGDGAELLSAAGQMGFFAVAGDIRGTDVFPSAEKTVIMIGNEARGLSPDAIAAADALYRLPMPGRAESLNAAVAAGLLIYKAAGLV